jgi:DIM1 family U5 snRNP protein
MSSQVAHSVTQLNTSIAVDETILSDDPRIIVMRFGSKSDAMCKLQDATIMRVAPRLQAKAVFYLVDTIDTPELVQQYDLYDPCSLMFFHKRRALDISTPTGNDSKVSELVDDKVLLDLLQKLHSFYVAAPADDPLAAIFQFKF